MKALILNSGTGQRLKPATDEIPKCLVRLNGKTILEHQLEILESFSVNNYIITTGPFENKIKETISESFKNLNVIYVHNPKFKTTNYIYSMWLTRNVIDDDILLLHGDLVFESKVIEKIIEQQQNNAIVYKSVPTPEKDFKAQIIQGSIKKISVSLTGKNVSFLMPLYFWTKQGIIKWLSKIDEFIQKGFTDLYAEDAFNDIADTLQLYPLYLDEEFCMEIDTFEDLERARKFIFNKL